MQTYADLAGETDRPRASTRARGVLWWTSEGPCDGEARWLLPSSFLGLARPAVSLYDSSDGALKAYRASARPCEEA
jgi:hypothetical protein